MLLNTCSDVERTAILAAYNAGTTAYKRYWITQQMCDSFSAYSGAVMPYTMAGEVSGTIPSHSFYCFLALSQCKNPAARITDLFAFETSSDVPYNAAFVAMYDVAINPSIDGYYVDYFSGSPPAYYSQDGSFEVKELPLSKR